VLLLGVHPIEDPAAPGEAVHGANDAAATAQVDIEAALAWRDYMVSSLFGHGGRQ
jgi:dihydrolipoamide dehydrogenase